MSNDLLLKDLDSNRHCCECQDAATCIRELEDQLKAAEKNAERYLYAKQNLRVGRIHRDMMVDCFCDFDDWDDAAIDVAIRALKEPK